MSKCENVTPEYIQELEETVEDLRSEVDKYKAKIAEMVQTHQTEQARLTAEYEDKISVIQEECQEEVQELKEQIEGLDFHITQLINDNTIMDAQLDIVKMMCGVRE